MIASQSFKRDIFERDRFEPSTEEKIFLVAKRGCILFAGMALALGVLDLTNIHSTESARAFWQNSRMNVVAFGDTVRTGVQSISIIPAPSSSEAVAVRIPARVPVPVAAKVEKLEKTQKLAKIETANSPVAELSAARTQDAVQLAMTAPPALTPAMAPAIPTKREVAEPVAPKREVSAQALPALRAKDVMQAVLATPTLPKRDLAFPAIAAAPKQDLYEELALPKPVPARLTIDEPAVPAVVTPAVAAPAIAETPVQPEPLIPLAMVPLPREAPGAPPPSPAERLKLTGKDYNKAERCLANAVYFEARSEPVRGQIAVAQVVMNRVFSGFYPNDVCSVVYQNAGRHLACQFTFACDGKSKVINERGSWARANRIARQTLEGQIYLPEVAKSTHYHASYVHPNWVHEMKRLARFGIHSFYRPYAWGNGAEDPVWGSGVMAQASAKKTAAK